MNALESPHALPGDANGAQPTPLQHLSAQVLTHASRLDGHDDDIATLKRGQPYRGVERALLVALLVLAAATMGGVLGLVHYARELVQHLPR